MIDALQGGPIKTLYAMTRDEAETLLQAAGSSLAPDVDPVEEGLEQIFTPSSGAGLEVDAGVRAAIERCAVNAAKKHFAQEGYAVTEHGKPFDLSCKKGSKVVFVEVKGTTGTADKVILTYNEVQHAEQHPKQSALFILHSIKVNGKGAAAKASGGTPLALHPWTVDKRALKAISYWYSVPGT